VFPALLDASVRRPNITVLTVSLPGFCKAAACHPNDFVAAHTKHPSARGYASFADLFVCVYILGVKHLTPFMRVFLTLCVCPCVFQVPAPGAV